jgi:hypothetical protein
VNGSSIAESSVNWPDSSVPTVTSPSCRKVKDFVRNGQHASPIGAMHQLTITDRIEAA